MKIYLIRHAQRGHGEEQDTLTDEGLDQAQKLVKPLSKLDVKKIICGSSNRARLTLEPTTKVLEGIEVEYTDEVNEHSLGVLQGKTAVEWRQAVAEAGVEEGDFRPEGGENVYDAFERAQKFVEKLKRDTVESMLIISHSGFIANVAVILLNKTREESRNYKSDFCALTYLELDDEFNVVDFKSNQQII